MIVAYGIISMIQLALAVGMYKLCKRGVPQALTTMLCGCLALLVGSSIVGGTGTLMQAMALFGIALLLLGRRASTALYAISGLTATIVVAMIAGTVHLTEWSQLKAKYPMISLAGRLEYESGREAAANDSSSRPMNGRLADELSKLRETHQESDRSNWYRTKALQRIHASTVEQFIDAPGFGVGRMLNPVMMLERRERKGTPVPQPMVASTPQSAGETPAEVPSDAVAEVAGDFEQVHRVAQAEFSGASNTGYLRDIDHVAGFVPHAFTKDDRYASAPLEKALRDQLVRLELVSLLKHRPPRVYVSKELPNMETLKDAPTRPVDRFEQRAIEKLTEQPSELVAESDAGRIRMLGGILAVEQCLQCHQAKVGDLLGAFSYELRPTEKAKVKPSQSEAVVF